MGLTSEVLTAHSLSELGESFKFPIALIIRLIHSHMQSCKEHCVIDEVFTIVNGSLLFKV